MSIRTPQRGPISAGIVPLEQGCSAAGPSRKRSLHDRRGHRIPAARCGSAGPMDARTTSR